MVKRRRNKHRDKDRDRNRNRGRERGRKRRNRQTREPQGEAYGAVTTGRQTLQSIEQAIQDLRRREAELQTDIERLTAARADEVTNRLQAYRDLAEVKARDAVADGVIDEADRLSSRVASLLSVRQKTIDELRLRQASADQRRQSAIETRDQLLGRIDTLEQDLDGLAIQAREELATDPSYQTAASELEEQQKIHRKASDKARRAHDDRDAKGSAYENDPLFMYLWQRNYGQSEYRKSGVVRWLDSWVANLVGYPGARANYAVLNEIPIRLDEHVERLADNLVERTEALEAIEADKIRELADGNIAAELRDLHDEEIAAAKDIQTITAELSDLGEQLNKYAEGHDPAFAKAIEMSAAFLGQHTTQNLITAARETPTASDDEITSRISSLDRRVKELSADHDRQTAELEKTFERRDELLRIAADFRRNHYDDSATEFRGEDLAKVVLDELIRGAITGAEYWGRTRRRKSRRKRPADSFRRSQNFPPFDLDDMFDLDDVFDFDDDFWTEGKF